jgi:hypothetical protein
MLAASRWPWQSVIGLPISEVESYRALALFRALPLLRGNAMPLAAR